MEEHTETAQEKKTVSLNPVSVLINEDPAERISDLTVPSFIRTETGMEELDRVLGGGLVSGSVVLLTGDPESANQLFASDFGYSLPYKTRALCIRRRIARTD